MRIFSVIEEWSRKVGREEVTPTHTSALTSNTTGPYPGSRGYYIELCYTHHNPDYSEVEDLTSGYKLPLRQKKLALLWAAPPHHLKGLILLWVNERPLRWYELYRSLAKDVVPRLCSRILMKVACFSKSFVNTTERAWFYQPRIPLELLETSPPQLRTFTTIVLRKKSSSNLLNFISSLVAAYMVRETTLHCDFHFYADGSR